MTTGLTELKVVSDNTALATAAPVDALAAYADAIAPQYIIGEMLRFSKGDWIAGKDTNVELGTTFVVAPDELLAGWIHWLDGKPIAHEMVRVDDGIPPKLREELGNTDPKQWPVDKAGQAKDPWQFTNYLPMINEEGKLFTFTTASRGGIGCIAQLCRIFAKHRVRHPTVYPLIAINVDSYQHKDPTLGRIKVPVLAPAGYMPKAGMIAALAELGAGRAVVADVEAEDDPEDKMDDAIPF